MKNLTNFGPDNGDNNDNNDDHNDYDRGGIVSPNHEEDADADNDETDYANQPPK